MRNPFPHGVAKDGVQALYKGAAMPMGGARLKDRIQFAFGAQFVEVRVHAGPARSAFPGWSAPSHRAAS